ncbi:Variant-specific surface protein [Giardia duodenalis]|uniref:Variant-specific surface protein n=1 Tax=Giardia intestinalis TaxID=5741 RepID=V6TA33_GIAIN|nr:Variant-specific surface protein [Giardia intestinalis]
MLLVAFCFALSTLAATCSADTQVGKCKENMCEMAGSTEICTECKDQGNVPIDGICKPQNDNAVTTAGCKKKAGDNVDASSVRCEQCDAANHFLYKGGCYSKDATPGNQMCKTVTTNGICAEAATTKNYFAVPGATKTDQSVVWCGDVEGVTLGDGKKYTGVDGCTTCEKPEQATDAPKAATCNACGGGKIVKTVDGVTSCVEEADCNNGYFVDSRNGKKCSKCASSCKTCENTETQCTSCTEATPYLKKEDGSETGTCVNQGDCPATHYIDEAAKTCTTCISGGAKDCKTCEKNGDGAVCKECPDSDKTIFGLNRKSCVASCPANSTPKATGQGSQMCECNEGLQPNTESTECRPVSTCNTEHCLECTGEGADKEVCTKCLSEYYLTPTSQCVSDCATLKGYYGDDSGKKTCKKCNDACAECKGEGADKCTACPAGKMLKYTGDVPDNGGTCVDQCSVSSTDEGCAECGAQIGGTAYCSKCKNVQQAPLNGNCAANSRAAFCTKMGNGVCTQCENNYFLKDGGCYQTDRQPGKQVCSSAQGGNGKCQTCANGLAASDGNCEECHPTCATCSAPSTASSCKTCATGYYKTSNSDGPCKKCSERFAGCRQCTVSSTGAFMCLEMGDGTGDNTGGSTNKSSLSTGAIAGISVAVVVVVGGLVGFLCWWFICRGKA